MDFEDIEKGPEELLRTKTAEPKFVL